MEKPRSKHRKAVWIDGRNIFETSYDPSQVDDTALDAIPRSDVHEKLDTVHTVDEVVACIQNMNTGKAPGFDGIPVELMLHGATNVHNAVFNIILSEWSGEPIQQYWIDAMNIFFIKGKERSHFVQVTVKYRSCKLLKSVRPLLKNIYALPFFPSFKLASVQVDAQWIGYFWQDNFLRNEINNVFLHAKFF